MEDWERQGDVGGVCERPSWLHCAAAGQLGAAPSHGSEAWHAAEVWHVGHSVWNSQSVERLHSGSLGTHSSVREVEPRTPWWPVSPGNKWLLTLKKKPGFLLEEDTAL